MLQLWEQGLVDLDAPANDYLRPYQLVPAKARFRPATVRQLLTHTAGIRELLHPSDLLGMRDLGETVKAGRPVPSLAEYYRGGLRIDAEPGTGFTYNNGFATLGKQPAAKSPRSWATGGLGALAVATFVRLLAAPGPGPGADARLLSGRSARAAC